MPYLYLDLETRSELDVRRVGSYAYAAHPSTEILLGCYAVNDEPVETWWAGEPWPFDLLDVSEFTWVAHNIDFERNMLRAKEVANVPLEHWLDTAALAARQSLPRSLEELGEFFFPTDQSRWKDMAGNRVMQKLARPRKPSASDPSKWWTRESKPEDFAKLEAYCRRDVELMRDVHRRLLPLGQAEHRVWAMTERMNERGVKIDLDSIPPAQAFLDQHRIGRAHV